MGGNVKHSVSGSWDKKIVVGMFKIISTYNVMIIEYLAQNSPCNLSKIDKKSSVTK